MSSVLRGSLRLASILEDRAGCCMSGGASGWLETMDGIRILDADVWEGGRKLEVGVDNSERYCKTSAPGFRGRCAYSLCLMYLK